MRRALLTALFLVLWAMTATRAAAACAPAEVAAPGQAVGTARAALMRIPLQEMDTVVPPPTQRAIETVKDRIIAFVTAALRCTDPDATPSAIQRLLAGRGDAFEDRTVYSEHNPPSARHGGGLSYEVRRVPGHASMLAVVARLQIECGDDAVLLLLERSARGWRPLLIRRSPPYREISGALGSFRYAVSPPDANGSWYVATVRRPPWCTSAWSSLYFDFSRPGPSPTDPRIFFRERVGVYAGYDDSVILRADAGRFQLVHDGGFFDAGILIRRHVETYAVDGNAVRRIGPVAFNVRDFVDEWIDASWPEASAWSAPLAGLPEAHRTLSAPRDGTDMFLSLGPIRRCASGLYQVQVDIGDRRQRYLLVSGNGPWRMEGVSWLPAPRCTGPDLGVGIESANTAERRRRDDD
jgi:hypothetical protein